MSRTGRTSTWLPGRKATAPPRSTVKPPLTRPKIVPSTRSLEPNAFSSTTQASSRRARSRLSTASPRRFSIRSRKTSTVSPIERLGDSPAAANSLSGTLPSAFRPTSMTAMSLSTAITRPSTTEPSNLSVLRADSSNRAAKLSSGAASGRPVAGISLMRSFAPWRRGRPRAIAYSRAAASAAGASRFVVSSRSASGAGFSGAAARARSRSSRSVRSRRTVDIILSAPRARNSARRRSARASGAAVRNIFTGASGRTTVPMSRPSSTAPAPPGGSCAKRRCQASSARRTAGCAATLEAAAPTASSRRPGASRTPGSGSDSSALASASATAASSGPAPRASSRAATAR